MKEINKKVKKMDFWDVGFMKWSVVASCFVFDNCLARIT